MKHPSALVAVLVALAVVTALAPVARTQAKKDDKAKQELEVGKWYPSAEAGVTLTQSAYSDNWKGGDKGSLVWAAIFNGSLERRFTPSYDWSNSLKLAFGQTHQQKLNANGDRVWERPEKSTDLIDFETILRMTKGWVVDPYVSSRIQSQFLDASDPAGRNLKFNPFEIKESAGIARKFLAEQDNELLTRLGFTLRQNVRRLFVDAAPSTDTSSKTTNDGGIEWVTDYKTRVLEDKVAWTAKLSVYQPFFYSAQDKFDQLGPDSLTAYGISADVADFAKTVDIDWQNVFTTQITKVVSVNLYVEFLYDKYDNSVPPVINADGSFKNPAEVKAAIRKKGQFKQTLGIGITYRFL